MSRPVALVLTAPGTNRDHDVAFALDLAGAEPRITPLSEVVRHPELLDRASMAVVAGGFSHADALGAGRMWALELSTSLGDRLRDFVAGGRPVVGICNGFQVLVRTGLLPGALGHNASGHFQCEWVTLLPMGSVCVWTRDLEPFDCPIAHGEGRYVHPDPDRLAADGQVALRYAANPNGSVGDIAGVCDPSGVVLGLMPHPENHVVPRQHPRAVRGAGAALGLHLFEQGVRHAKEL
jgi:phosphoribosylformylglycinamidine synthase